MKKQNKIRLTLLSVTLLVLFFALFLLWLLTAPLSSAKIKILKTLPIPLAEVNGHFLTVNEFLRRTDFLNSISRSQGYNSGDEINSQLYLRVIEEKKISLLAGSLGVLPGDRQVGREYQERSDAEKLASGNDLDARLASKHASKEDYVEFILKPELTLVNLLVLFNGKGSLNKESYGLAGDLLKKLSDGMDFRGLARAYSQEQAGKTTGGDLGFVNTGSLLPEIRETVEAMNPGEVKIIPSRLGLHLIKLEERENETAGAARVHLKQIFIKTDGFENWYKSQTNSYNIRNIIKINI